MEPALSANILRKNITTRQKTELNISGIYDCVVWRQPEKYEYAGIEHKYQIVGIVGIYLEGKA